MPDAEAAPTAPADDAAILDEELAKLPDKYRLPLLLCGLEGMSHAAAGRQLGWPTGTVAGRVARGRTLLRTRLQRRGVSTAVVAALLAEDVASAAVPRTLIAATIHSANLPPAAVSAQVAALVHGVLKKMLVTRHVAALSLTVLATVVVGVALAHLRGPTAPERFAVSPPEAKKSATPVQARPKPSLELPKDPDAVVLRLERFVPPMDGLRTRTTIYAGGRMTIEVPKGLLSLSPNALTKYAKERAEDEDPKAEQTEVFEKHLSPAELNDLMRFALHEQEFFEFRPDEVKTSLRQRYHSDGSVYDPGDATHTHLFLRTAAQEHAVEWTRLTLSALRFKEVSSLAKLHALDMRLRHLFAVERAGGKDRVAALVQRTNELAEGFYKRHPHVPRLTAQDLAGVKTLDGGAGTRFTFGREKSVARVFFAISVEAPPDGDLKICEIKLPQ